MIPCMLTGQVYTTGDTTAELRTYKYKDITSDGCSARITLYYRFANNNAVVSLYNIVQLYPSHTNTTNLGSPSLQWNDTYTRHILIDNDINIWSSTINKTSNSGLLALRGGTNYSDGASIGLYGKDYNGGIAGVVTINAYGNFDYTNLYIYPNGTMSVYNNSTNTTKNIAMQEDVNTLLSGKANSSHTHTTSDITDFPTIPSKTSDLTNDSGFLTSHQDLSGYVPKSGGAVLTGADLGRVNDTGALSLWGGSDHSGGAKIDLYGKGHSTYSGCAFIRTCDANNNVYQMALKPDGTLTWGSKNVAMYEDVIPRSGGAAMTGSRISKTTNDGELSVDGGIGFDNGATITLYGKNNAFRQGSCTLYANNGISSRKSMWLHGDGTLSWDGTAIQYTSDKRLKQQISKIDNNLLDAWEDVTPCQFKYNDAVNEKGDNARLHTGYVVQQINEACQKHDVDISDYGLYCHEEYPERTEEVTITNEDGTIKKETKVIEPAREYYSLRYTETLVVECAYLRRENDKLKQQFKQLKETVNELKSIINYSEIPNS